MSLLRATMAPQEPPASNDHPAPVRERSFLANSWRVRHRGVLCDGDSVFCAGGDPTHAEGLAEMRVRDTVAYPLLAAVIVILALTAAVAWKRRRREIVLTQGLALLLAFALLVIWKPYRHVEDFQPPLLGSRTDVTTDHQPHKTTFSPVRESHRLALEPTDISGLPDR